MKFVWAFLCAGLLSSPAATASEFAGEAPLALHFDNDLFSGGNRDEDYSWGASATLTSTPASAWQIGIIAMTPRDLLAQQAIANERPYASLVYVARSHVTVSEDLRSARFTSMTAGALGLNVAQALQAALHDVMSGDRPRGWQHQIADGGELTGRITHARQWLLGSSPSSVSGASQTKLSLSGSLGYLTEATVGLSWRGGRLGSDWWTHSPELVDYTPAAVPEPSRARSTAWPEWYFFGGVRLRARAYNALLQGQFRHSDVRISADDLARLVAEGWLGASRNWGDVRLTYTIRVSTKEIEHGPGARDLVWGSLDLQKSF